MPQIVQMNTCRGLSVTILGVHNDRHLVLISFQKEEEEIEEKSEAEEEKNGEENPRHSIFERVAASVRSLSFR